MRAPAAVFQKTIVVIDPSKASRDKASAVLAALGYTPEVAADAFEALPLVDGATAVLAVHPTAEPIYPRLRAANIPLVVSLSAKQPRPAVLAAHLAADSFVLRPYRKEMVAVALYSAATAQLLREQRQRLELALAELSGVRRDRHGGSGLLHIDLFKKLLPLEIRRAGRHGYPIALLVVALDPLPHGRQSPQILEELALACEPLIRAAVRDVDLAVRYGEGRFLVLLPHTDARGAETVARRIVEQIRSCRFRAGGATLMPTASVGVATQRQRRQEAAPTSGRSGGSAHPQPSFARMVRDAHAAVRAAQLKGGDRFILRG